MIPLSNTAAVSMVEAQYTKEVIASAYFDFVLNNF
jgi:hypothetical protein